ncbi:hypothetical protein A3Q56_07122 [Intoshia linei]|uniref:Uncharacterized protein n=1 Tax=Intoshia linei TaxID=1819745 RepID=A0A177AT39_9BILA|nr:hypothetical protein A3Q56_07122 [Intoshia linei]
MEISESLLCYLSRMESGYNRLNETKSAIPDPMKWTIQFWLVYILKINTTLPAITVKKGHYKTDCWKLKNKSKLSNMNEKANPVVEDFAFQLKSNSDTIKGWIISVPHSIKKRITTTSIKSN